MYILLELKLTGDNFSSDINTYNAEMDAKIAYYQLLAQAISSEVELHTIVLMTTDGIVIEKQSFAHQIGEPNVVEINNNTVI